MKKSFRLTALLITASLLCFSCATTQVETKVDDSGPSVREACEYQGPRARIALSSFTCKAAKCGGRIGDGLTDMLTTALFKTGRFVVLERGEGLRDVLEEQELAQTGLVEQGKGPETGLMEGADILIKGAVTGFEPDSGGGGLGIGGMLPNIPFLGGLGGSKKEAYISADIRLIDTRIRRVVNAISVEGKATSWKLGGLGGGRVGGVPLAGGLGGYKNTPMEKAVRVMLDNAIKAIADKTPESYYRYSPNE